MSGARFAVFARRARVLPSRGVHNGLFRFTVKGQPRGAVRRGWLSKRKKKKRKKVSLPLLHFNTPRPPPSLLLTLFALSRYDTVNVYMVPVTKSVDGATDATNDDALAKNSNRVIATSAEVPVWDSMLLTKVMVRSPALSTVPPVLDRIN